MTTSYKIHLTANGLTLGRGGFIAATESSAVRLARLLLETARDNGTTSAQATISELTTDPVSGCPLSCPSIALTLSGSSIASARIA